MTPLESRIEELYRGPLDAFVAARTALAKTLAREDAKAVKSLQKPAAVAWAVNQVYWHARPVYDRLIKSGSALRAAQVAALGGRSADVRGAGDTHRKAIADALKEAARRASAAGINPSQDALTQTFEALSLATKQGEPAGRLTKPLQPAGFEALAGVAVKEKPKEKVKVEAGREQRIREEAARAEREACQAAITTAQAALAQAQEAEAAARVEWQRRKRELEAAEHALARLQRS